MSDMPCAELKMHENDLYGAYVADSILNESPVGLVVALYEGAIDACVMARKHLESCDIPARTKAINKIINILTELMRALNDEKGGEVSKNLRRLYLYMQGRVLEAQTKKKAAPLAEVEKLMSTMLEGWKVAEAKLNPAASFSAAAHAAAAPSHHIEPATPQYDYGYNDVGASYGSYF
jgi:flagellar protein FliS